MEILESPNGAVLVLKPLGAILDSDVAGFRTRAFDAAHRSVGRMVVDASAIPFIDSAAIEALVDLTEQLAESGRALKLCAPTPTVRLILELTGWVGSFEFFDDVPLAVRSFL